MALKKTSVIESTTLRRDMNSSHSVCMESWNSPRSSAGEAVPDARVTVPVPVFNLVVAVAVPEGVVTPPVPVFGTVVVDLITVVDLTVVLTCAELVRGEKWMYARLPAQMWL